MDMGDRRMADRLDLEHNWTTTQAALCQGNVLLHSPVREDRNRLDKECYARTCNSPPQSYLMFPAMKAFGVSHIEPQALAPKTSQQKPSADLSLRITSFH